MSNLGQTFQNSIDHEEMAGRVDQAFLAQRIFVARLDAIRGEMNRIAVRLSKNSETLAMHGESLDSVCLSLQECLRRELEALWQQTYALKQLTADLKQPTP